LRPNDDPGRLAQLPRQLLGLTAAFGVVFLVVLAAFLAGERRLAVARAERRLATEAALLAEHTMLTLREATLALDWLAEHVAAAGGPGAADTVELQRIARDVAGRFPQIGSVFAVGPGGALTASSDVRGAVPKVDVSDRDYFRHHREDPSLELHVGAPVRSRLSGGWRFFLTRRVDGPGGRFEGVVGVALDPGFYDRFFSSLELPAGKRAVLYRRDGLVLVQTPFEDAAMGQDLSRQPLFTEALPAADGGAFHAPEAGFDRSERWVGYRRVPEFPLVATVSASPDQVFAESRRTVRWQAGIASVLFAVIAGLALGLARHARRLRASLEARARLEAELIRTARLESLAVLAGGIAHDFKNLLGGVLANVEVAREEVPAASETRAALDDAAAAARRADGLARQLLAFSGGGAGERGAASLPALVEESARFVLHGSASRLELQLAPGLRAAAVDEVQLGQVIQNLVLNADQAMPGGGVIRVSARNRALAPAEAAAAALAPGEYVEIAVSDQGPGVDPEHAGRIFDPFFTTKQGGHGLGLAVVDAILRRSGGKVTVASEPGHGSTFRLLVPAAAGLPPGAAPAPGPEGLPPGLRVLVVDDEPLLRAGAVRMLARLGCEAEGASDGAEALRRCRSALSAGWRYDAVVADVTIVGGLGGRQLLGALRALDPGVRVILSSGWAPPGPGGDDRADGWLGKPYTREELASALVAALRPPRERAGSR
jgi:signal transduction histidine kinase